MMRGLFFTVMVVVGLSSCNKPESPQFKYLENVVVEAENPPDPTPGLIRTPTFCPFPS